MKRSFLLIPLLALLAACGTQTHIIDSWRDPDVVVDTAKIHQFVVADVWWRSHMTASSSTIPDKKLRCPVRQRTS